MRKRLRKKMVKEVGRRFWGIPIPHWESLTHKVTRRNFYKHVCALQDQEDEAMYDPPEFVEEVFPVRGSKQGDGRTYWHCLDDRF